MARSMPDDRAFLRKPVPQQAPDSTQVHGPSRGFSAPNENPYLMVHPISGPDLMPQGVNFNDTFHQKLAQAQQQFLIKGSQRGDGSYTASQTGAKELAIRHFEDAARTMQKIAAYRRAKATI